MCRTMIETRHQQWIGSMFMKEDEIPKFGPIRPEKVSELLRDENERPDSPAVDVSDSVVLEDDPDDTMEEKRWKCPSCGKGGQYTDRMARFHSCANCGDLLEDLESRHRLGLTIDDVLQLQREHGGELRGKQDTGDGDKAEQTSISTFSDDESEGEEHNSAIDW